MEANISHPTSLSYSEIRKLSKDALISSQEGNSDFIATLIQKVYQRGWQDGVKRGIQTTYDYLELFRKK